MEQQVEVDRPRPEAGLRRPVAAELLLDVEEHGRAGRAGRAPCRARRRRSGTRAARPAPTGSVSRNADTPTTLDSRLRGEQLDRAAERPFAIAEVRSEADVGAHARRRYRPGRGSRNAPLNRRSYPMLRDRDHPVLPCRCVPSRRSPRRGSGRRARARAGSVRNRPATIVRLTAAASCAEPATLAAAGARLVDPKLRLWRLDADAAGSLLPALERRGAVAATQLERTYDVAATTADPTRSRRRSGGARRSASTGSHRRARASRSRSSTRESTCTHPEFAGRPDHTLLTRRSPPDRR